MNIRTSKALQQTREVLPLAGKQDFKTEMGTGGRLLLCEWKEYVASAGIEPTSKV